MSLLTVESVEARYGDFQALFGIDIEVNPGESVAIIGANGAGKSTLLRSIMGQVTVPAGRIVFDGADLAGVSANDRVGRGIALVPEGRRLFPSLSVRENLMIGSHAGRPGPWTVDKVVEALPLLERLLDRSSAKLSGGEQQAVAIGRALMSNPDLLLLDEVSLGLAPVVVRQLYGALSEIRAGGTTMVVVEQDIGQALAMADRVYCMLEGRVSLSGAVDEVDQAAITAAYFGVS
ncbi:MAG: ABC transporter ATP-binding protein [Actinomycetota bacterium]